MVGSLEQFVAKKFEVDPEMSEMDRTIIGSAARLTIPFSGRYQLRQVAGILRAYADMVEFWTRQHDMSDRTVLFNLKHEAKLVNAKIRDLSEHTGKGKKPKDY